MASRRHKCGSDCMMYTPPREKGQPMSHTTCAPLPYDVDPGHVLTPVERVFCELVAIDAPSFHEHEMSAQVRARLEALGFTVEEDDTRGRDDGMVASMAATRRFGRLSTSAAIFKRLVHTGSDCGNLFATLPGSGELAAEDPILFITHLDTVLPAHDKRAHVHADGLITSCGDTVLGADDLAAIAEVLAAVRHLRDTHAAHRPIELCCMVAEEVGNVGARAFDFSRCRANMAYTLDYSGDASDYAYQAPSMIYFTAEVLGKAAHAGFEPENGIHAIKAAARAIEHVPCGRIGDDTTVNVGIISGGRGGNVVPSTCVVRGEVRSYDDARAHEQMDAVRAAFEDAASDFGAQLTFTTQQVIKAYRIDADEPVVRHYEAACRSVGLEPHGVPTFGGSDNSIAVAYGIPGIVIANGMRDAHSTHEHVLPGDLDAIQRIVEALLTLPQ